MNSRERVIKTLSHIEPDRVPYAALWGAFTPSLLKEFHEKMGTELPRRIIFSLILGKSTLPLKKTRWTLANILEMRIWKT